MLFAGATIDLNDRQAAELIACGAIAPEPIATGPDEQFVAADLLPTSETNQGEETGTSGTSGDSQNNSDQTAGADAAQIPAEQGKKKPATDKAAT